MSFDPYLPLLRFSVDYFYPRDGVIQQILDIMCATHPGSLELLAFPQMGKSSLLRFFTYRNGAIERYRENLGLRFDKEPERLFLVLVKFESMPQDVRPLTYLCMPFRRS